MIASLKCPRCKSDNAADQRFCQKCGYGLLQTDSLMPLTESTSLDLVGQTVAGKYRVVSVLGEGGFGMVYRVEQVLLGQHKTFALKVLHPQLSQNEHFRTRFTREASIAMSLVHPNAIAVRDFGVTEQGQLYFSMDFCAGESLKNAISREGFLTLNRALAITRQVLNVLDVAHERQIIHRDLKPENLFLDRDDSGQEIVRVGDFGLARDLSAEDSQSDLTRGGIVGTPRYMSPEQGRGQPLDGRSDLYSVGVLCFEMISGQLPPRLDRKRGDAPDVALLRLHECLPDNVIVPSLVLQVIARALEMKATDRYRSAAEFLEAIESLPTYTPTYIEPAPSKPRWRWLRSPMLWSALIVIGGVSGGAYWSPEFRHRLQYLVEGPDASNADSAKLTEWSDRDHSQRDSATKTGKHVDDASDGIREPGKPKVARPSASQDDVESGQPRGNGPAKTAKSENDGQKPDGGAKAETPPPVDWGTFDDWHGCATGQHSSWRVETFGQDASVAYWQLRVGARQARAGSNARTPTPDGVYEVTMETRADRRSTAPDSTRILLWTLAGGSFREAYVANRDRILLEWDGDGPRARWSDDTFDYEASQELVTETFGGPPQSCLLVSARNRTHIDQSWQYWFVRDIGLVRASSLRGSDVVYQRERLDWQ